MAESVVSVAADHISSMIEDQENRLSDVKPELQTLLSDLKKINEWLLEAEKRKEQGYNKQTRAWLAELRMIAYQAEDEVDTFVLPSTSLFRFPRVNKVLRKLRRLIKQMEVVKTKLDKVLNKSTMESPSPRVSTITRAHGWHPSEGHLHPDEDFVVAIHDDVERLVQQLVGKSSKDQPSFDVLAIVGMGGVGKTTLARKIYTHKSVKRHFHCQAWVTLSPQWNVSAVLLDILRQAAGGSKRHKAIANIAESNAHEFDALGTDLKEILTGRRFLVVLDDVWNSDSLSQILKVLIQHSNVSIGVDKIILTSRNRVLSPISTLKWTYHETRCLDASESWVLFAKTASKTSVGGLDREYEHALGKEMLGKCQGLPLAIVGLATLLKTKDTIQEWERVFSQIDGPSMYRPVNDILALSFDELPYYLKPCFLYLGLFPQGLSISGGILTRMWVAEGFVRKRQNEHTLEEAATRCLQGLVEHNMVQVEKKNYAGEVKTFRIHDIMRELCMMKAHEFDFLTVFPSELEITKTGSRRAAINLSTSFTLPIHNPHIRSLVLYGQSSTSSRVDDYANKRRNHATLNLVDVCENCMLLRVLDLSGIKTSDGILPTQIGSLIHLRYLRMRSTNIKELPKSISKLRNLLTLDYWDVYGDGEVTIPNVIWKLKRLRHLYLPTDMSKAMGKLKFHTNKDLQTLWGVKAGDWMKNEMNNLCSSLKKLYIHGISNVEQRDAVYNCPLIKTGKLLYSLALDWYGIKFESLDALCSNDTLQKLRLRGRVSDMSNAINFPNNLQKLELSYTRLENQETMAALGKLRSLKFLRLCKDSYVGSEWTCSQVEFPELQELRLCNISLQKWKIQKGALPCLKNLSIVSCLKLTQLPQELQCVFALEQLEIERMPHTFCNRISQAAPRGEDYHIIQHIPDVKIRDIVTSF